MGEDGKDVILPWVEARSVFPERTSVHGGAQEWAFVSKGQGHEPTVLDALPARFVLLQFGRGNWHLERMLMEACGRNSFWLQLSEAFSQGSRRRCAKQFAGRFS